MAEFQLTQAQSDAALGEAALQVIRQEPERYVRGTLAMFVELLFDSEKSLQDPWEGRTGVSPRRNVPWPESLAFVKELDGNQTYDYATVDTLVNLFQDYKFGPLIGTLFLLGAVGSLVVGWRNGAALLPLIVVTQLLLHAALVGALVRYRYPLQPLITLVAIGGLAMLVAQAQVWTRRFRVEHWAAERVN